MLLQGLKEEIKNINLAEPFGEVTDLKGGLLWVRGLSDTVSIGSLCQLTNRDGVDVPCEVVAFEGDRTLLMGYKPLEGVGPGCPVRFTGQDPFLYPSDAWLGRIINGFGEPVDHKAPLPFGGQSFPLMAMPIPAHNRGSVGSRMDLGVRAMNSFTTCCAGQRLGIFAGSGVGKSVLLSQLAKYANADVIVIGLIGERGREVKEFIEEYLGPEGLERAVLVVATSDETALMRRRAAYATMTVAEYFRAQGKSVLCLMDSLTRFAMALREIGLAVGESPTTKGYTPNVFAELPRLLERSGPGLEMPGETCAQMTGLFTVLVEGDDHNEPVADTVRGIIDGHIVLERKIAERGRFPAINILRSISRMMPQCNQQYETDLVNQARKYLSTYEDMEELIRLGAYRKGSNPEVDKAIFYYQKIEAFLSQQMGECMSIEEGFAELERILNTPAVASA